MDKSHVKQVATFEKLLGFCNAHGAMFNPGKAALQRTALSALLTSAQQSLEAVHTARTTLANAVDVRNDTFNKLPVLMTRIVNALAAGGATNASIEEAYRFVKKFYRRKKVKASAAAEGVPVQSRSTSQLGFDSRVDHLEGLVKLVSMDSTYNPNEPDLQVPSLQQHVNYLRGLNTAVMNAQVQLSNVRVARNAVLYEGTGIRGIAKAIKQYVKSAFGYKSDAFRQISSLSFSYK
jgi:hypothetical protein